MNKPTSHPSWRPVGITLAALLGLFSWTPTSSAQPPAAEGNEAPTALVQAGRVEARERFVMLETVLTDLEQQLKTARDGIEGNSQALADIRGRLDPQFEKRDGVASGLDTLGVRLKQNDELLKEQESRLEDNSIKLYETLIGIDSVEKELALLRRSHERMRSVQTEMTTRDSVGDQDRLGLPLPLVLCLLLPLAMAVNQGGLHATPTAADIDARPVGGILVTLLAGGAGFFLLGMGIMYGPSLGGVLGNPAHFLGTLTLSAPADLSPRLLEDLVPHMILASIVAVIASSSVPRELTHRGHFLVAVVAGAFLYPLFGHWIATPTDISAHSGWLAGPAFACSAATSHVALLGGGLALSLASGPGLKRPRATASPSPLLSVPAATTGAILLWIAWLGVTLLANPDCQPLAVLSLSLAAAAGGAALGASLVEAAATRSRQWHDRLPFAVLAGIVAAPAAAQEATVLELAVLGALAGVTASALMRFFDTRSMADSRLASALLVGGVFGTLAPVIFGPVGFLSVYSIEIMTPKLKEMVAALLLGLAAGRALAWPIGSTHLMRTRT